MRNVDVLIVGGGASGLTASLLLSSYGVDSLLVSKYAECSTLPKAHLLSLKTMEMYRELGLEDQIRARSTPPENMRYVGWYAGIAGPTPNHGREIARLGAWGRGHQDEDWRRASASPYANLMQSRLEPMLRKEAEARAPGAVNFNHNFVSLEEDADGVVATIEDRTSGENYQVRARYLLACDGGRAVGPQLGVTMEGHLAVATNVSIHFSADLSQSARDPEVLIRTIFNPDVGVPCVLVPVGPDRWGPESEQWVLHFISLPGDYKDYTRDEALAKMRLVLGLPELEPEIHVINRWPLDAVVASHFRVGRTFIIGDAAHRMPPSGGHGLNTAVQDCYNLCWKIASVLNGEADPTLLDSYETERRPVAERTVASAFHNWHNARTFGASLDFGGGRSPEDMWRSFQMLWDGEGPEADAFRHRARGGLTSNLTIYNHLNINFGHEYAQGAIIPGDAAPPEPIDPVEQVQNYRSSTRPGCSVPHATLEDMHSSYPLGDKLGFGRWVLIAGEDGEPWCDAARAIAAERGVKLEAARLGIVSGDWLDMRREWLGRREIGPGGAILVRPDRFIAWRSIDAAADPAATLADVFDRLLGPADFATIERPLERLAS